MSALAPRSRSSLSAYAEADLRGKVGVVELFGGSFFALSGEWHAGNWGPLEMAGLSFVRHIHTVLSHYKRKTYTVSVISVSAVFLPQFADNLHYQATFLKKTIHLAGYYRIS